jgi:hypothetical protein
MIEKKVQRKIFGAEEVEGGDKFRILHYELCDSYRPSGIVSVKKLRNYDGLVLYLRWQEKGIHVEF